MEPDIVSVVPTNNFEIVLSYTTGERKLYDVKPLIKGSFYGRLQDPEYFKQVTVFNDGWNVGWPEGQDLGTDDLYQNSVAFVL
jgi:hypothetical protein